MKEHNQTIIAIAHRLSTIRNADMIAVVQGGKIVETGTHSTLLEKKGAYYGLIEAQGGGSKIENKPDSENSSEKNSDSEPNSRRSSMASDVGNGAKEHLLSFKNGVFCESFEESRVHWLNAVYIV